LVFPTWVRRKTHRHAFEEALDDAQLDPQMELGLEGEPQSGPVTGPAVGSLGDITVASGYVASASLVAAYGVEAGPEMRRVQRPAEAARRLRDMLGEKRGLGAAELARLRRRFAAENHPDRVPAEMRDEAVRAMAEVNAEIDRALKAAKEK
jgi:hypothetical protein